MERHDPHFVVNLLMKVPASRPCWFLRESKPHSARHMSLNRRRYSQATVPVPVGLVENEVGIISIFPSVFTVQVD